MRYALVTPEGLIQDIIEWDCQEAYPLEPDQTMFALNGSDAQVGDRIA